ncbi:MAG: histidinol-phosphate transaminase [Promethearchaeota archaeon]|nr:MAG: histidinol-phosphate transaminase [Candidatus Lokiarchaeota archaeon]
MKWEHLISKNLRNYIKYTSGASVPDLLTKFSIDEDNILKLDANENVFIEPNWLRERINEAVQTCCVARYPDNLYLDSRSALANYLNIKPEQILLGNGSDDILDVIVHAFLDNTAELITAEPTFSMYEFLTKILGAKHVMTVLDEHFEIKTEEIIASTSDNTRIIILSSPNNPTGNQFSSENLKEIIESTDCIVVIDEAYVDFADYHLLDWINKYDNLIIMRTFSKSWGLAGLRVGYAAANADLITFLKNVQKPYSLNIIGQAIIPIIIENIGYIDDTIQKIRNERQWLTHAYQTIANLICYPSVTNFFLLRIMKEKYTTEKLIQQLMQNNLIVRDRSDQPLLQNCVRITIGTHEMNEYVISSLQRILGAK